MTDRERVINGLQKLHGSHETMDLLFDAIVLLKEQEPPTSEQLKDPSHYGKMYKCRKCGTEWYQQTQKYCQECGTAVRF